MMRVRATGVLCLWLCLVCFGARAEEPPEGPAEPVVDQPADGKVAPAELEVETPAPPVSFGVIERQVGEGLASWYGGRFHGRRTANGERFDMNAMTAAHPTLPFGTVVRVRSEDGRTVDVRINDRGPWIKRRVIDLSRAAAEALGVIALGTRRVVLSVISGGERKDHSSSPSR